MKLEEMGALEESIGVWAKQLFDPARMKETASEISKHPSPLIYVLLVAAIIGWLITTAITRAKRAGLQRPNTPDLEKPAARATGRFKAPEREPGGKPQSRFD